MWDFLDQSGMPNQHGESSVSVPRDDCRIITDKRHYQIGHIVPGYLADSISPIRHLPMVKESRIKFATPQQSQIKTNEKSYSPVIVFSAVYNIDGIFEKRKKKSYTNDGCVEGERFCLIRKISTKLEIRVWDRGQALKRPQPPVIQQIIGRG